jgi:uncharacterized membrane protein YtjA (UPF0391 family)
MTCVKTPPVRWGVAPQPINEGERGRDTDQSNDTPTKGDQDMFYWALVFFIIALVAGVLGFGGIAAAATDMARVLFFIFLVIFLATLVLGLVRR